MRKNKISWFRKKKCKICKNKGTKFIYIDRKHQYVICDNPECDLKIRIRIGMVGGINIKGAQNA